jgi:DNA-binding FadR family transcriptional regulator
MILETATRTATLSVQVAGQLERLITSGRWPVGTRIPAENKLVSQLGVSRNTVREALRSLVHTGLLEARVGDGTYVRATSELEVALIRRAARANLQEAFEVRGLLEQAAAKLASQRRKLSDVAHLHKLVRALRDASGRGDVAGYSSADLDLHHTIVASTGNEFLTEIYDHLGDALKLSITPELWDQALAAEEVPHHEALVRAIAAGDGAAAEDAAVSINRVLQDALLSQPTDKPTRQRASKRRSKA